MKHETHEIVKRVGYDGYYCLIVPDHAAGRRNRFTVYVIPSSPSRRVRIIGQELTIGHARRVANASLPKKTRKESRSSYGPCDDCGVVGCNIHQIMGWASPPD